MIASVIEVKVILLITFFSFMVESACLVKKKEAAGADVSVRYDGLRVFRSA
jgi:hypothetical protein